jgi:protein-disulfide isomerase
MTNEVKIVSTVGALMVLLIGGAFFAVKADTGNPSGPATAATGLSDAGQLVRDDSYFLGPKDAKVTVVEFADYQCPACKFAFGQVNQIEEEYKGKSVKFVFRNFPLPSHKNAQIAHNAAEEAGKQGKFWEMHHKLFENQEQWSSDGPTSKSKQQAEDIIVGYARELGINADEVRKAIEENRYNGTFSRDLADGEALGVTGTPSFYVNGKQVKYTQGLRDAIEAELVR